MKRFALATCTVVVAAMCLTACSKPVKPGAAPADLVGLWATDGAKLNGEALLEGTALYVWDDGSAALVAGPPAIGVPLRLHNSANNGYVVEVLDPDSPVKSWKIEFDRTADTIRLDDSSDLMRRLKSRLANVTPETIGLDAAMGR